MKKMFFLPMISLLFVGGLFSGFASAQGDVFDVTTLPVMKSIYWMDDMTQNLPFVVARNAPILAEKDLLSHGAADGLKNYQYQIDNDKLSAFLAESTGFDQFYQKVRITLLLSLIGSGYGDFNTQPYDESGNFVMVVQSGDFKLLKNISQDDHLDLLIHGALSSYHEDFASLKKFSDHLTFKTIGITADNIPSLGTLFLFKNEQDLRDLGYQLVSRKTRINMDHDYRRHNIMAAFNNIGNVRLIMPGQIFDLAHELHYSATDIDGGIPYVDGLATFGNGAKMVYGGGLCGVATALFQGSLTNLGLNLVEYKAHSTYYRNLYEADINGTTITQPGLDATLYSSKYDLKTKNIRDYPIIVAFNFDGMSGSQEQVFTLAKAQDKGSFAFVREYKNGENFCFTWDIKGNPMTNCYGHIKNYN